MSLKPEDLKEAMEFATRFGGSAVSVFEQMLFDWAYQAHPEWRSNPIFSRPHPDLPSYSTILVSGLNVAPWVASLLLEDDAAKRGDTKNKELLKGVREFTEGGVLYTVPRLVRITAVNTISKAIKPAAQAGSPIPQPGQQQPPAREIVIQL